MSDDRLLPTPRFPPVHGITVGQLVPRRRSTRGVLTVLTAALLVMSVAGLLSLVHWLAARPSDPADTAYLAAFAVLLVPFATVTAETYLKSRVTELTAWLGPDGIRVTAGRYSQHLPWQRVAELRVVRGRSEFPVLCVTPESGVRFRPSGLGWRLKLRVHRRLFGTPLAVPLASTGVDGAGALAVLRGYLPEQDGPRVRDADRTPVAGPRGLAAALALAVTAVAAAAWAGAVAVVVLRPAGAEGMLLGVAAVAGAVAGTVTLVPRAAVGYSLLVPLTAGSTPEAEPVLQIGPDGLTQVVRGRSRHLPWSAIRRVRLTGPPEARVLRAECRFPGGPVTASLPGSGVTEPDLLCLVRQFAPAQVELG